MKQDCKSAVKAVDCPKATKSSQGCVAKLFICLGILLLCFFITACGSGTSDAGGIGGKEAESPSEVTNPDNGSSEGTIVGSESSAGTSGGEFSSLNVEKISEPERSGRDMAIDAALEKLRYETKSGYLLLKATELDWGLHAFDSFHTTIWLIFDDGNYAEIKERGNGEYPGDFESRQDVLSADKIAEIESLIKAEWESVHYNACDGTGYQFDVFAPNGSLLKTSGCGYIYGNQCLETLAKCMPKKILPSWDEMMTGAQIKFTDS